MIQWLSDYNYDFALAAIPVQVILLLFYCFRRNLPVRQHRSFLAVMAFNLTMTVADIVSCEMNEIWTQYPLWVMYGINLLYFISFILRGWALFDYTAESCYGYQRFGRLSKLLFAIPAAITLGMILSTPWTAAIFTIAPNAGYFNCAAYPSIYYCTYFYIFASFFCIFFCWKQISNRRKIGLLSFNALLLFGIIIRKLFYHTLITSYFSILVILIIYLNAQNPDLFRHHRIKLFNKDAFLLICTEFLHRKTAFQCVVISAHNYESMKHIYGTRRLYVHLRDLGGILDAAFPHCFVFYLRNGNFMILSRETGTEREELQARQWHEKLDRLLQNQDDNIALSFSVMLLPYSRMPQDMTQIDDLVYFTYGICYQENQKGNYLITNEMLDILLRQKKVEAALSRALKEHSVEVYFQPIYSTAEERVVGAEALARLRDRELGYIPPCEFISIAERNGDIIELGRQIFERVCMFIDREGITSHGIRFINVNLSPAQCLDAHLVPDFAAIAETHRVPMSMFDFEITESSIEDPQAILQQILRFQEHGAELSIDDFGTGTSNLTRLMKLPIHVVKLDMTVVHSYFSGESTILPDLIRMFRNSQMKIVVEGVETVEMKHKLAEFACDYQQGYYFSKPVPPTDFLRYLEQKTA